MKNKITGDLRLIAFLLILVFTCYTSQARIVRVIVTKTEPYLEGKVFGTAGPYEKLTGQAYGEVDPGNPLNSMIQGVRSSGARERKGDG